MLFNVILFSLDYCILCCKPAYYQQKNNHKVQLSKQLITAQNRKHSFLVVPSRYPQVTVEQLE